MLVLCIYLKKIRIRNTVNNTDLDFNVNNVTIASIDVAGFNVSVTNMSQLNISNISAINLSATEITTLSATIDADTLTMGSSKYLENTSNYAFYYKNGNSAMTGTTHLVEFNSNILESALVTKTSNSRYTINRAGYYRIISSLHPENTAINDRVCFRGMFLKNGVEDVIWSSDSFCYTRDDNFGDYETCPLSGVLNLALNDYIEVQLTAKIGSNGFFSSNMTGTQIRLRSNLTFQYLG